MAKETKVVKEKVVKEKDARQLRWDAYVAGYAEKNPVKYAAKKANGEFDKIPDSFV